MAPTLAVTFTGLRFENPFLLSSAPPTESEANIMRAFDAGWGGVVSLGQVAVMGVGAVVTANLIADHNSDLFGCLGLSALAGGLGPCDVWRRRRLPRASTGGRGRGQTGDCLPTL